MLHYLRSSLNYQKLCLITGIFDADNSGLVSINSTGTNGIEVIHFDVRVRKGDRESRTKIMVNVTEGDPPKVQIL